MVKGGSKPVKLRKQQVIEPIALGFFSNRWRIRPAGRYAGCVDPDKAEKPFGIYIFPPAQKIYGVLFGFCFALAGAGPNTGI